MKKSLGSVLIFILLCIELSASTYKWNAYVEKNDFFVNENIYLKYVCEFSDRGELYTIKFNPVTDNETYSIRLLSRNTKLQNSKRINTYEYIATVKKPMLMQFSFDIFMQQTTKDSIENTVLGRDNIENEEFLVHVIKEDSIKVNIKETDTNIVGNFKINVQKDKADVKAYEPYHLNVQISGTGNFQEIKPIQFNIDGVKIFTQEPKIETHLTKDGEIGSWNQQFAFVGNKDFEIPNVNIKYFDLALEKIKSFDILSTQVKVTQVYKKEKLLDDVEEDREISFEFIYYILTFIAGFLMAKINFNKQKINSKDELIIQKIQNTKSLEILSMLLILENQRKFSEVILELDTNKSISLSEAKKKALKLIQY